jgi:hypothetical protein
MEVMAGLFAPSKAPMSCAIETPGETVVDYRMAKRRRVNIIVISARECFLKRRAITCEMGKAQSMEPKATEHYIHVAGAGR